MMLGSAERRKPQLIIREITYLASFPMTSYRSPKFDRVALFRRC